MPFLALDANASDIILRPVNLSTSERTQAAISIGEFGVDPQLYAEDGTALGTGHSAATGFGRTVCTMGCIAFGGGRFMASLGVMETAVKQGTLDKHGNLVWTPAFNAPGDQVKGISYCGGRFFITSRTFGEIIDELSCHIASSSNGKKWSTASLGGFDCGQVAHLRVNKDTQIYCAVGLVVSGPSATSLYSSTSNDGLHWSGGAGNPSRGVGLFPNVGGGNGVFVTGGAAVSGGDEEGGGVAKAAANVSPTGAGWSLSDMPIPGGTDETTSSCDGAIFVNPGGDGHFVAAVSGYGAEVASVYMLRSKAGSDWTTMQQWGTGDSSETWFNNLSIVGANIGTIVTL